MDPKKKTDQKSEMHRQGRTGNLTVHEVAERTGVSIRTLHYYDEIGLLPPSNVTEAGYRLYTEKDLERLQTILFYRELQFPLKEICAILQSPVFERNQALDDQIRLLEMRCEHIQNLITLARSIRTKGETELNFKPFDTKEMDAFAEEARQRWSQTDAYQEYAKRQKGKGADEQKEAGKGLMELLAAFGSMQDLPPEDERVQQQVAQLQAYITEHFYTCIPEVLAGLGSMYVSDERMKARIDEAGGAGTAETASRAISAFVKEKA